jgi:ORF6N domain
MPAPALELIPVSVIESRIYLICGQKVLLDADLANLYQVTTSNLNLAVRRNADRFPEDFMFQLSPEEFANLTLQSATSSWGGRRYPPYAFTEQGVAMLSSVLNSPRSIQVNIAIMRTFVHLRQFLTSHEELAQRLNELERQQLDQDARLDGHSQDIEQVFEAIRKLIEPPDPHRRPFGFPIKLASGDVTN